MTVEMQQERPNEVYDNLKEEFGNLFDKIHDNPNKRVILEGKFDVYEMSGMVNRALARNLLLDDHLFDNKEAFVVKVMNLLHELWKNE